jgi:transglutaminase-like putative cysteine protease
LDGVGPPLDAFLRPTPLTDADAGLRDFAAGFAAERARGTLQALHALMSAIHQTIAPLPGNGEREGESTAAQALARGTGGCQDHTHLFIACCRLWGVPARYVSGYLHTQAEEGLHLATHAWAEAVVEYLGWVSFDPSNCQSATQAYVRLAVGFDVHGAAPVRGVRRGGGGERLRVRVVEPEQ